MDNDWHAAVEEKTYAADKAYIVEFDQKPTLSRLKLGLSGSWQPDCWIM